MMTGYVGMRGIDDSLFSIYFKSQVDRINYLYTGIMMIVFAVLVSTGTYVGQPMHCWLPGALVFQTGYVLDVCWVCAVL